MKRKDLSKDLDIIAEQLQIDRFSVVEAFKDSLEFGCKKEHDVKSCRVEINEDKGELNVYKQYLVIDINNINFEYDKKYDTIDIKDARKIKSRIEVGEILEIEINPSEFGPAAAGGSKTRFNEKLFKRQKEILFERYRNLEGEVITATVIGVEQVDLTNLKPDKDETDPSQDPQKNYRLDIGNDLTTKLVSREALVNDNFQVGDRVKVLVTSTTSDNKKITVYVSRKNPKLVEKLLEATVPELKDGTIEIMGIARDPGDRTKIALKSNNPQVEAIGACIGEAGIRIRSVKKELNGENIDLFKYSDNERELIANSLKPAEVIAVTQVNPIENSATAIVRDDQLSLAIGKQGQNVRLAVQTINWKIDIKSQSQAEQLGIIFHHER